MPETIASVIQQSSMIIHEIPVSEIYSDSTFNIRGEIRPTDIVDLARNIDQTSLLQPISVQPYNKMPGCKWRIVAGHRRHAAFKYLDRHTIPAIIIEGLSEIEAMEINFVENVNRRDLNMVQEARGLERFVRAGRTIDQIAARIAKGKGWVQVRLLIPKLPPPVQDDVAAGFLTHSQIQQVAALRTPERQMEATKMIKDAKIRGDRRLPPIKEDKKKNPTKLKRRNEVEIADMIDHVIEEFGETTIVSRTLAWVNGDISDLDLHRDLMEFAHDFGKDYIPPKHILPYLK